MKKIACFFMGLFLLMPVCFSGIISFDQVLSANDVTIDWLNSTPNTIFADYNGNIETGNILNDTITDNDLSTAVKFENWYTESFGDWTYSGMLPATDATLTSDISAGTSFVKGQRIVTSATSKTYTASKDTWVYIDKNGSFQYQEVANGATQPSDPANSLLLAKVVTDNDNITSVSDQRRLTPTNLRIYSDYKNGVIVSRDISDIDVINLERGEIEFGSAVTSGYRRNTSQVDIDFAASGRGGLDTGSQTGNTFYYLWAVADDDNTTNYEGIASLSSSDATGVTGERLVGWVYAVDANTLSPDSVGAYRAKGGDAPNIVKRVGTTTETYNGSTDPRLMPDMLAKVYTSGSRPVNVRFSAPVQIDNEGAHCFFTISWDNVEIGKTAIAAGNNTAYEDAMIDVMHYPEAGEHTVKVKWYPDNAVRTVTSTPATYGDRVLIIEEK